MIYKNDNTHRQKEMTDGKNINKEWKRIIKNKKTNKKIIQILKCNFLSSGANTHKHFIQLSSTIIQVSYKITFQLEIMIKDALTCDYKFKITKNINRNYEILVGIKESRTTRLVRVK